MNFKRMKLQKVNLRETPKKINNSCFGEMRLPNFMLDVKFLTLKYLLMIFHCFLIKASKEREKNDLGVYETSKMFERLRNISKQNLLDWIIRKT